MDRARSPSRPRGDDFNPNDRGAGGHAISAEHENLTHTIDAGLKKLVNTHGQAFQYAVLNKAIGLFNSRRSGWRYEAHELPVEVNGQGARVDFVLKKVLHNDIHECFLLAECKRANPRLSNWCFFRAPVTDDHLAILEQVNVHADGIFVEPPEETPYLPRAEGGADMDPAYHVGLELKSRQQKGDSSGTGRDEIEKACTQVLRGVNGFLNLLSAHPHVVGPLPQDVPDNGARKISVLPVIFTTANTRVSEVELGQADLGTGNLTVEDLQTREVDWVRLRYHQSPGLEHSVASEGSATDGRRKDNLLGLLKYSYARDIVVVNSDGIGRFLEDRNF